MTTSICLSTAGLPSLRVPLPLRQIIYRDIKDLFILVIHVDDCCPTGRAKKCVDTKKCTLCTTHLEALQDLLKQRARDSLCLKRWSNRVLKPWRASEFDAAIDKETIDQ
jgi:hypothetical protein